MNTALQATDSILADYSQLFVNRTAFTIQCATRNPELRRSFYYRPKGEIALSRWTLRKHLLGEITIGLYAINPSTQKCKWVAIDADYAQALPDLLKLQWELKQEGIDSAIERSRRGGHLWILAAKPILARNCRIYVHELARRLHVPIRDMCTSKRPDDSDISCGKSKFCEGIEVFPKQDQLAADQFGNAIRAPLGVHRGADRRYWFYGADYSLEAQIDFLKSLKKITPEQLDSFVQEVNKTISRQPEIEESRSKGGISLRAATRSTFSILSELKGQMRRIGRNYFTRCPSCASQGRDRHGDNLAICISDPCKYCCWAGCTKEQIRAALGRPIRLRPGCK
jgi:hypothetical protein